MRCTYSEVPALFMRPRGHAYTRVKGAQRASPGPKLPLFLLDKWPSPSFLPPNNFLGRAGRSPSVVSIFAAIQIISDIPCPDFVCPLSNKRR